MLSRVGQTNATLCNVVAIASVWHVWLYLPHLHSPQEDKNCPTDLPCMEPVGSSQKLRVLRIKPSTLWFARHEEPLPRSCTRFILPSMMAPSYPSLDLEFLGSLLAEVSPFVFVDIPQVKGCGGSCTPCTRPWKRRVVGVVWCSQIYERVCSLLWILGK